MKQVIQHVMVKQGGVEIEEQVYSIRGWLRPIRFTINEKGVDYGVDAYGRGAEWERIKQDIEDKYKAEMVFIAMRNAFGNATIQESGKRIILVSER